MMEGLSRLQVHRNAQSLGKMVYQLVFPGLTFERNMGWLSKSGELLCIFLARPPRVVVVILSRIIQVLLFSTWRMDGIIEVYRIGSLLKVPT